MRRVILFLFVFMLALETGAGLFTSVVVYPVWTRSPEIVATWKPSMPYFMQEGDFFMFASPTTMLLSIVTAIAFLRRRDRVRPWVLVSSLTFLAVGIWTLAYFLPAQDWVQGDPALKLPREEVASILENFITLNWIRQLMLVVALITGLHALGLTYRGTVTTHDDQAERK
ncbi:MAG TPA: DUF1772 domain-containing protein [Candidatus Kapabacteria bacterium]|nr:DUF1772 domain-containing protein [Candidatus Kapabacteria bacterium]